MLANKMNDALNTFTTDIKPFNVWEFPELHSISVPEEHLPSVPEVDLMLSRIKTNKSVGPDDVPTVSGSGRIAVT